MLGALSAQAPDWMWVKQAGGGGYDFGLNIINDAQGNNYICGYFMGDATFGAFSLASQAASQDIFVAKLDPEGNWLWAIQAGGTMDDQGRDLALDSEGNIYLTGSFSGSAAFGSTTLTSTGDRDIFVAKISSQGIWLWAQKAGGNAWDEGHGIATDSSGNSYLTGVFRGEASFGDLMMTSIDFFYDVFVAKIDASGNWLWAEKGGGSGMDQGNDIALGDAGNAYVTGSFVGSADFGAHPLVAYGAQDDIFVGQISTGGTWMWAEHAGSTGYDVGSAIVADSAGNSYVTGYFWHTATFGSSSLTNPNDSQTFVAKLDTTGVSQWAKQPGGTY